MSSNKRSTNAEWSNNGEGSSRSSKRVRFGGDKGSRGRADNLTEIDDSDLLEQRKTRRGAVTNVAYNSGEESSDDEEFDQRKKKTPLDDIVSAPGAADEDEDDMFADPEDIARRKAEKQKKKGKSKGFDASEIQGEDLDLNDLDEKDYDSDGNPKIEAFNMKEELEDGGEIDEAGNFIRKLDPDRFHDSWLEGLSRKEIQAAKQAHERKTRQAQIEEREAAASAMTEIDIYLELVNILRPSESVVEALQRLGGGTKKSAAKTNKKKSWQKNKQMDEDKPVEAVSEEEVARKKSIEKLTDLCDKMMALGHFDIYEETYEQVVRQLRRADLIADDWVIGTPVRKPGEVDLLMLDDDPLLSGSASWEYKWVSPPEGQPADEVYGPFSGAEMKSWTEQGFFSQGILARMVGDSTFEPGESVTFE
ncbi:hypothetical protein BG006_008723 [Podila minutissima]|uniref:GYF domain-containing protein n=1 Tax=Podila minutissima TaxID=64525 RepID=A0A9P5VQ61_9FUNG|nr:hypothetical protein BG006_008723 [Podila minutissima]